MFCLKQYDTPLIEFEITNSLDGQQCIIEKIYRENVQFLPIGMETNEQSLYKWLRSRIIPKNREYVDAFLAKNGLSHKDTKGILEVCRGLSLNDSYWITDTDFDGKFKDFNLFENEFIKMLSLIAYTGYGNSKARGFSLSPEFTTNGALRKGWRKINGKTVLYKGGTSGALTTGKEPYSEFYAAQIADTMGINHVHYGLSKWKKELCSTCELFTDINHSFVPIFRFIDANSIKVIGDYIKSLGEKYYNAFTDMAIFDALILNEDRHSGNFGLMVDNHTNKPYAFAPLFDNGISLFNYAMPDDFNDLNRYASTRMSAYGVSFDLIAENYISPRHKQMLRKMIGFKFVRDKNYNLPAKQLSAIERYLQYRVNELLNSNC